MHPYATNSPLARKSDAFLMLCATVLATCTAYIVEKLKNAWGWRVGGISAMAFYGVLSLVFDRHCWRWPWVRKFLLVPDLNGLWYCRGRTVLKDGQVVDYSWDAKITICQSWTRIVINLETSQSRSQSIAASLYADHGLGYRLIYHYDNKPGVSEPELKRHTGLCDLLFAQDVLSARGDYYSDKDRMTVGTMQLTRKRNSDEAY